MKCVILSIIARASPRIITNECVKFINMLIQTSQTICRGYFVGISRDISRLQYNFCSSNDPCGEVIILSDRIRG